MFCDRVTTRMTTKAFWMEESSHASQIVAKANFLVATTTYPDITKRIIAKMEKNQSRLYIVRSKNYL